MIEFSGEALAWLTLMVGTAAAAVGYFAWARRKITVWFASPRLITAAPSDQLEIVITHRGEVVELPVYLVHLEFKCAGNRDVAMQPAGEFIEIEAADGIEFLSVKYGAPGKLKLETVATSAKSMKFSFDLLKRTETIVFNLVVKSSKDLEKLPLAKQFPTTVHVRDVRKAVLATNRYELWGGAIAMIGIFGLIGGLYVFQQFLPVDQSKLLIDDAQKRVMLRSVEGAAVNVCEATTTVYDISACRKQPIAEVASFVQAPKIETPFYVNVSPMWQRVLSLAIVLFAVMMFSFGKEIFNSVVGLFERLKSRN